MSSHFSMQGVSSTSQLSSFNSHFLPNGIDTKSLNVCFSNVRSLLPKIDEFRLTCLSSVSLKHGYQTKFLMMKCMFLVIPCYGETAPGMVVALPCKSEKD